MDGSYKVRRKGRGWIITLPPDVRRQLGVTGRGRLYWHLWRRGEVVLSVKPERRAGRPEVTRLVQELADAHAQMQALREQLESRERTRYAEGYSTGYEVAMERIRHPSGPSARRYWRKRSRHAAAPRPVEVTAAPVLDAAPSPLTPGAGRVSSGPAVVADGATSSPMPSLSSSSSTS